MSIEELGYSAYIDFYGRTTCPSGVLIIFMREEWSEPYVGFKEDLSPYTNANGLYWKLSGIANHQKMKARL